MMYKAERIWRNRLKPDRSACPHVSLCALKLSKHRFFKKIKKIQKNGKEKKKTSISCGFDIHFAASEDCHNNIKSLKKCLRSKIFRTSIFKLLLELGS